MITDLPGVRVGHATDPEGRTGCTVVLFPEGTVASGEVRGGAPATREVALLDPARTVARLDALVLSGGSAFGLAAADGVVRFCEERGMGVPTPAGPVPIVVGLSLFDLAVGDPRARPGPDDGYAACEAATAGPVELGTVGAGTGATVGTVGVAGEPSEGTVETADVAGEPSQGTVEMADVVREPSQGTEERAQATGVAARATGAPAGARGDGRAPGGLVAAGVTAGGITV
ncbi:MAG: P1 family peptidase, partial [Acidimicrobiia bacterium]